MMAAPSADQDAARDPQIGDEDVVDAGLAAKRIYPEDDVTVADVEQRNGDSSETPVPKKSCVASSPSLLVTPLKKATVYNNGEADAYEMLARPRGYVLIINNENFVNLPGGSEHESTSRVGSQFDAKTIEDLFKELYFEVEHGHDLSLEEMRDKIKKFARKKQHEKSNACFVFIMSHGGCINGEDSFYSSDGKSLRISWVDKQFNNAKAVELVGKPKVLVFQCCRGDNDDRGVVMPHHLHAGPRVPGGVHADGVVIQSPGSAVSQARYARMPTVSDMLVLYSTVAGHKANREHKGSWYIQELCRAIRENAHDTKLRDILDEAAQKLAERENRDGMLQSSEYVVRTFKNFYFNPYIPPPENDDVGSTETSGLKGAER